MNLRAVCLGMLFAMLAFLTAACTVKPIAPPAPDAAAPAGAAETAAAAGTYAYQMGDQDYHLWLRPDGTYANVTGSGTYTVTPEQITFVADFIEGGSECGLDPGVYTWSADGASLTLTPVSDDCKSRASAFGEQALTKVQEDGAPVAFVWRIRGAAPDILDKPMAIAIDQQANIYVVDGTHHRIQKFDTDGNLVTQWGSKGDGDGQFVFEADGGIYGDIAVDGAGNVYVSDAFQRVQKFDSNGKFLTKWGSQGTGDGQFADNMFLGADEEGNVYVSDANNNRIQKFDSDGNYLTQWGNEGGGDGEFDFPFGVAADHAGHVFVVDLKNFRVQKFDSDGNFLAKWGSEGTGDGQFTFPLGVAVDSEDNVYVTDNVANRVVQFDNNGKFLTEWGRVGDDLGTFNYPRGIAVDTQGNVYVANVSGNIQKFQPQ